MKDAIAKSIYLSDYQVSNFLIDRTDLSFELGDEVTVVRAKMAIRRNPQCQQNADRMLLLDGGIDLQLQSFSIDGRLLGDDDYRRDGETLAIFDFPEQALLESVVHIQPQLNTALNGLYQSREMYCSQCEAQGFRQITFYLDRPDIMSEFTTEIVADAQRYPVLLSNGNPTTREILSDGRHRVIWHDPFVKPAYLFALVAGSLSVIEDSFVTSSGRTVALQIFVEDKDTDKCAHAMTSLKKSMRWDEEVYGREYDLDIFMIVAVDDFNMGAMENKGLNIFNTSAVLANPATTTDASFQNVEAIVAHEYFHNWSGNRVTCRDWFQLSLKEGFTVFRDAQFSADMNSPTVKRIQDVAFLRTHQFAEDGGPMSHPVQPDSYMEINNFYTVTIYEKGAEIVGMLHSMLGSQVFRQATDLYFQRHDGQAVTIEEFVVTMEETSGRDLSQFRRWYKQSGTPRLDVTSSYSQERRELTLKFQQHCPDTPGQTDKAPFLIPVVLGLLSADGSDAPLNAAGDRQLVIDVTEAEQQVVIENVAAEVVPSLLRGFSAPVKLHYPYTSAQLAHLMTHDSDGFNRWDAGQQLALNILQQQAFNSQHDLPLELDGTLVDAYQGLLDDVELDAAMVALMLQLPGEALLHETGAEVNPIAVHDGRQFVRAALAGMLQAPLERLYERHNQQQNYSPEAQQIGSRSLKNAALDYLMLTDVGVQLAWQQFQTADNMTDQSAALRALVNCPTAGDFASRALESFEKQWRDETLVINLWLQIQATNPQAGGLIRIKPLLEHAHFSIKNPNKVRSMIGAFCQANLVNFHASDGSGYAFLARYITELNAINPQVAARLVTPLTRWRKYAKPHGEAMRHALQQVAGHGGLAKDIQEIVTKSL